MGAAILALGLAPGSAGAASVSETNGSLGYAAAAGEANHVTIVPWGFSLLVTEKGTKSGLPIALTAGTGCWKLSSISASCSIGSNGIQFDGGDGADSFDATALTRTPVNASGGSGDDVLRTGGGADTLDGGDGSDTLSGGAGNDTFQARDGAADTLTCGAGSDAGIADAADALAGDCESVLLPAPPDPGTTNPGTTNPGTTNPGATDPGAIDPGTTVPTSPAPNAVPASVPAQTVGVSASGVASVKIVCPAGSGGCSGTVVIDIPQAASTKKRSRAPKATAKAQQHHVALLRVGKAKFSASAGSSPAIPVRLSKRGRQRILRAQRSKARITVTSRSAAGQTVVTTQEVTIKPPPRPARRGGRKRRS
jgi:hypothetical protein